MKEDEEEEGEEEEEEEEKEDEWKEEKGQMETYPLFGPRKPLFPYGSFVRSRRGKVRRWG